MGNPFTLGLEAKEMTNEFLIKIITHASPPTMAGSSAVWDKNDCVNVCRGERGMSCPYTDDELSFWDSVSNPMGTECNSCTDFDCEHNSNIDENPEYFPDPQECP